MFQASPARRSNPRLEEKPSQTGSFKPPARALAGTTMLDNRHPGGIPIFQAELKSRPHTDRFSV